MSDTTALLNRLQQHQGAANGITAEALAAVLDTTKRHIRTLVSELRLEGIAVCGHPKTGYFIAANDAEIEDTCKFLRSRALHSLTLESRLRKVTLPDLLGQMRLKS
jgi:biotin operon repressor